MSINIGEKYDYKCLNCKKKIPCKMMLLDTDEDNLKEVVLPTLCLGKCKKKINKRLKILKELNKVEVQIDNLTQKKTNLNYELFLLDYDDNYVITNDYSDSNNINGMTIKTFL